MSERKFTLTFVLILIGTVLTLVNGLWVANNGKPITFSSFNATSVEQVTMSKAFWGRIAFGIPRLVEGSAVYLWLIIIGVMLLLMLRIYMKPRKQRTYGIIIALLSLLSLPIGGGFYVGAILCFIGGISGTEWPKPFSETFFGRFIKAALLNSEVYAYFRDNAGARRAVAIKIMLIGTLSGLGSGLYVYNVNLITMGEPSASSILLGGNVVVHETSLMVSIALIGVAMIRWLLLSTIIYWVGVKLSGISAEYDKVARVTAFAFIPEALLILMPLMFSNEPTLSFNWPTGLYVISRIWIFLALVVALTQIFESSGKRALGVALLGGVIYWITYHLFIIPTLGVPGYIFNTNMPASSLMILMSVSAVALFAVLLGAFSKKT